MSFGLQQLSDLGGLLGGSFRGQVDDVLTVYSNDTSPDSGFRIYIRYGARIDVLNVSRKSNQLTRLWSTQIFNQHQRITFPPLAYPWHVTNTMMNDGTDTVIIRIEDGLNFYRVDPNKPPDITKLRTQHLLSRDTSFRDLYGWEDTERFALLIGRFYRNMQLVGVMSRDDKGSVQFYAAFKDKLTSRKPLWPLQKSKTAEMNSRISNGTEWYAADLQRTGQDNIILRTESQLKVYQFDSNYTLQQTTEISLVGGPRSPSERFFFVDLTGQTFMDIVHFNRHGMFVYQQQNATAEYDLVHYHVSFSTSNGWNQEYTNSLRMVDVNGDGRDDLLFTGPKGLTALSFNQTTLLWESLLDPSQLDSSQRFVTLVAATRASSVTNSMLLILDGDKKLYLSRLSTTKNKYAKTADSHLKLDTRWTAAPSPRQPSVFKIPQKINRNSQLQEKPALRWAEQWPEPSMTDAVDPVTGRVRFTLPLYIPNNPSDSLFNQISLSYDSQRTSTANLAGQGWTISLSENRILIDYRGSIYPQDAAYYVIFEGTMFRLTPSIDGLFQVPQQPGWTIEFLEKDQRWTIRTETDIFIYGRQIKKLDNSASDAIHWNLNWPNWRGPGDDAKSLRPIPVAWYLNERQIKATGRSIYYDYEIDSMSEGWTAAIRLKRIRTENMSTWIKFRYSNKMPSEYESFTHPLDSLEKGNLIFPVPLRDSHYLAACEVVTENYSQTLEFEYQVNEKGLRFLTGIKQPIGASVYDSLFQFHYKLVKTGTDQLLTDVKLPSGLKAQFQYEVIPGIEIPDPYASTRVHTVEERPIIDSGPGYVAMVYRQRQLPNQIRLKILDAQVTETLTEMSPISFSIKDDDKLTYAVQSYTDFCLVSLVAKNENPKICLFHHSVHKWKRDPACYLFSRDAFIRSSEAGVVIADPSDGKGIRVLELLADRSGWTEHHLKLPGTRQQNIIRLEMFGRLVVGYDDHQLFICHQDERKQWKIQILENLPRLFSDGAGIVKKFRLPHDGEMMVIEALKSNVLHLSSNSIAVCSLHLNGVQLSLKIRLFLLDANYSVARQRLFTIEGQNILKLKKEFDIEGTRLQMGYYVTQDGFFRLKMLDVSGKLLSEMQKESPEVTKEMILNEINAIKDWKETFDKSSLVNWNAFRTAMSPQGLHVSNDTFIRMTGDDWQRETERSESATPVSIPLGRSFVLKPTEGEISQGNWTLYAQGDSQKEIGKALHHIPQSGQQGRILNRYPVYLAYETPVNSSVTVVLFDDPETLGPVHIFPNEQLMMEGSSYERLMTLTTKPTRDSHIEPMECLSRSLHLMNPKTPERIAVSRTTLATTGSGQRSTGYKRSSNTNHLDNTVNVTVSVIPGNDGKLAGWRKETWTLEESSNGWNRTVLELFNSEGEPVDPVRQPDDSLGGKKRDDDTILWDRNKTRIVSNFSPYALRDQMVSYYGFESYEVNDSDSPVRWTFTKANVVENSFALTGSNYLHLKTKNESLEGTFHPRDQQVTYVASCWLRPSNGIDSFFKLDEPAPHLKAVISNTESGEEIVGLFGRVMRKSGDWSYLEVLINFDIVKRLYIESQVGADSEQSAKIPKFSITIKIEVQDGTGLDVDHIRFSPIAHEFKAAVYHPENGGQVVATIGASGSISRVVYYRGREMAVVTDLTIGQLDQVLASSRTGRLVPAPQGSSVVPVQPPCRLVFHPEHGLVESFDNYSWRNRWTIDDQLDAWSVAPGRLSHNHPQSHLLTSLDSSALFGQQTDSASAAFRCYYSLSASGSSLTWKWSGGNVKVQRSKDGSSSLVFNNEVTVVSGLTNNGELILMTEGKRFFLWIDGVLVLDLVVSSPMSWSSFALEAQGSSSIEDVVFMGDPRLDIEYLNEWGEKTQVIQLESSEAVLVSQTLYDALGRPAITTKMTRIKSNGTLLAYRKDFISNSIDPADPFSVWQTHKLHGDVDRLNPLDDGVPYYRTEYEANPLNEKRTEGLPGKDFTINGPLAKKYRTRSKIDIVDLHFAVGRGFQHKVEELPSGSQHIAVLDGQDNKVALYIYVPGFDHLLSTYEYDSKNRVVKILPPVYHERVGTLKNTSPLPTKTKDDDRLLQKTLGTFMFYDDETDRLTRKSTPDAGTVDYYYNSAGQTRLMAHSCEDSPDQIDSIVYYEYDERGVVSRTGFLEQVPISRESFKKYLVAGKLSNATDYQVIDRTEAEERHYDPSLATGGRNATFITHNDDNPVMEEVRWDGLDRMESRRVVSLADDILTEVKKTYYSFSNKLKSLQYPMMDTDGQPLHIDHRYNKLGQLTGLSLNGQDLVRFSYHGSGQLAEEHHLPETENAFQRKFDYNSPGFLRRVSDRYLTEDISYTEGGYGQDGYGDGIIMRTTFNATWPVGADWRWFQLPADDDETKNPITSLCLRALKRNGYLTQTGRPLKDYYYPNNDQENWMPLVCGGQRGQQLAKKLAEMRMPRIYGHRYSYGNHKELIKAKYFTEETEMLAVPLQPDSFAGQTLLNKEQSRSIWKKLVDAGFLLMDRRKRDWLTAMANPGKSLLQMDDLLTTHPEVNIYQNYIEKMILNAIGRKQDVLVLDEFQRIFVQWKGVEDGLPAVDVEFLSQTARNIFQTIGNHKWSSFLDMEFTEIVGKLNLPDIVRLIEQYFTYNLGQHPFDVASYDIDANGNHRRFYTGSDRYEFTYDDDGPNRIRSIKIEEAGQVKTEAAAMRHDTKGNVIQALHKGIERIEYHGASQRTTAIHLTDGRSVHFAYDAQGERILKQVFDAEGHMTHETHYVRDEEGRVLFDRKTTYILSGSFLPVLAQQAVSVVSTAYVYGRSGLVGFVRNGSFHSVITDHAGSIRLVVKDGQVVAAYDYLPYGQLMRSYGNDPDAQIAYRYTGQEWDAETGLYNYHARLYDPDIGRFYQPDPQEQYFSPYKYVGNSPVSLIDPDGEFGFLIACVMFAIGGAYLGGSAANNNWNPGKWDWKSGKTWLGVVGGGLSGAMIPISGAAAVAAIGIGPTLAIGGGAAYVSAAATNGDWDFTTWKWDKPSTYNALFQGFGTGVGIVGGSQVAQQFAKKLFDSGSIGANLFLGASGAVPGALAYAKGAAANNGQLAFWEWDWSSPETINAMLEGIDSGIGWPTDVAQIGRGIVKMAKDPKKLASLLPLLDTLLLKRWKPVLGSLVKGPIGRATTGMLTAYVLTSLANDNFNPGGWDKSSTSTYESFLNGLFFGIEARNMLKAGRKSRDVDGKIIQNSGNWVKDIGSVTHKVLESVKKKIDSKIHHQRLINDSPDTKLLRNSAGSNQQFSVHKQVPETEIPKIVQQEVNQLKAIEDCHVQKEHRRNEVIADREIGSMTCRSGGGRHRRKKRMETIRKICRFLVPDPAPIQRSPDLEAQLKLQEDPSQLLKEKPISTKSIDGPLNVKMKDGETYPFNLVRADGGGYNLKFGSNNDLTAVKGYWVNTGSEIKIDPFGETRFVFTSELQGCSIYVKYDLDASTMKVYHHNRQQLSVIYLNNDPQSNLKLENAGRYVDSSGKTIRELDSSFELVDANKNPLRVKDGTFILMDPVYRIKKDGELEIVRELNGRDVDKMIKGNKNILKVEDDLAAKYDMIIRNEDYLNFPLNYPLLQANHLMSITYATPVIYRDTNGQWIFASQKITYPSNQARTMSVQTAKNVKENFMILPEGYPHVPSDSIVPLDHSKSNYASNFFTVPLNSIPRTRAEANSWLNNLKENGFLNREQIKEYVMSVKKSSSSLTGSEKTKWTESIKRDADVGDVLISSGRSRERRSLNYSTASSLQCHSISNNTQVTPEKNDGQFIVDGIKHAGLHTMATSSGSRPLSWVNLLSTTGRHIVLSVVSLFPIREFLPPSLSSNDPKCQEHFPVDLYDQRHKNDDYRDVSVGNCYSFSSDSSSDQMMTICYGHHGQSMVYAHQSPSVDPPFQQTVDTFSDCRPVEWYGQPSVTCRGEKTTFIHTPYSNSTAANWIGAVDSWLLLAYVTPGMYREFAKFVGHIKATWTGRPFNNRVAISDESKCLWQNQLDQVEQLVMEIQSNVGEENVKWALPLIDELREQIHRLKTKSSAHKADDVRAVKTMTERLTALMEDLKEEENYETDVFYDCEEHHDVFTDAVITNGPVFVGLRYIDWVKNVFTSMQLHNEKISVYHKTGY